MLAEILRHKRAETALKRGRTPLEELRELARHADAVRPFAASLENSLRRRGLAVVTEIKRASPSRGTIRADCNVEQLAQAYTAGGAACLSVLTDERFFQGSPQDLVRARRACPLPVLRKDFVLEEYQLFEARHMGADCVLLIAAAFPGEQPLLRRLYHCARELGMDVLVEIHQSQEVPGALELPEALIGINNRDLHSFATDLEVSRRLRPLLPEERLVLGESGIRTREDVETLQHHGIHAFLVGETLMRSSHPEETLGALFFPGGH